VEEFWFEFYATADMNLPAYTRRVPFGFGHRSGDRELAEHGRRAPAEVLSSEPTKRFESSYGTELNGRTWILRLRVKPAGEPPFEVEVRPSLKALCMPRVGDRLGVVYDPGDHSRTAIDPALELATVRHSHSQVRAEVTLPDGSRAIADAQAAPPEHRAELERFAGFYAKGALSTLRTSGAILPSTVPLHVAGPLDVCRLVSSPVADCGA